MALATAAWAFAAPLLVLPRSDMVNAPELFVLRRIDWQFFCTLTFSDQRADGVPVDWRRVEKLGPAFAFVREVAKLSGCHFRQLLWCVRSERGELNGRLHYHLLLGGVPSRRADSRHAGVLKTLWFRTLGFGHADVRTWDGRDAVAYISDSASSWTYNGANAYELGKYGTTERIVLSDSVVQHRKALQLGPTTALNRTTPTKPAPRYVGSPGQSLETRQLPRSLSVDQLEVRAMFRKLNKGLAPA